MLHCPECMSPLPEIDADVGRIQAMLRMTKYEVVSAMRTIALVVSGAGGHVSVPDTVVTTSPGLRVEYDARTMSTVYTVAP